jgi:Signal transduction histidine kinase regulating C4-dicarboxylate transport system
MKVLVVDDNHFNLSVAKRYLEDIPEISEILLCDDSRQVKSIVDDYQIDILISDVMMPAITGFDLLKLFRSNHNYDDMPIIMLTSLDDLEAYKKCFELGAFDYMNKPFNTIELHSRLKVAIEARRNYKNLKSLLEVTSKQNEELKKINAELTEAKFSLVQSEKMAAIGQLAAGIAHEINNPMGYISSNFDILRKYYRRVREYLDFISQKIETNQSASDFNSNFITAEINEKYEELKLEYILNDVESLFSDSENGIKRITDIIQSLRIYGRSTKDNEKDTCVLLELIQQVILIIKNEVKYTAVIKLDIPEDIILYCNRVQLEQVFINIILNAVQAIKSQGRSSFGTINITARKIYPNIQIEFIDDGPGIPPEYLHKVFEPFFTTKEIGQGTGLGLSISYDIIVNKHHGSLDVKSEPGKGAAFIITLPIVTIS